MIPRIWLLSLYLLSNTVWWRTPLLSSINNSTCVVVIPDPIIINTWMALTMMSLFNNCFVLYIIYIPLLAFLFSLIIFVSHLFFSTPLFVVSLFCIHTWFLIKNITYTYSDPYCAVVPSSALYCIVLSFLLYSKCLFICWYQMILFGFQVPCFYPNILCGKSTFFCFILLGSSFCVFFGMYVCLCTMCVRGCV